MTTPHEPTESIDLVDELIAKYVEAIESGQIPNRQQLLADYPEQAEALRKFFADLDQMDRVAAPLRMVETEVPAPLETIRYFGDYVLLEEIARGGMGVVYKARQTSLNRIVALKLILSGNFASPKDMERFQIEAEAAAKLDHPNIVPVYEIGEHDKQHYFTMKLIDGLSLDQLPRGSVKEEVAGVRDVARAVQHAHERLILHRDLKPSNILVDSDGRRFVTDFGLAKRLEEIDHSLTQSGHPVGTPRYMAPEQAAGRKDITTSVDIYSLGVLLFERLTGRTPFLADTLVQMIEQVIKSPAPRLSTLLPSVSKDLETIVAKCLEKEPGKRYVSAADLAEDLDNWLAGKPINARPTGQI